VPSPSSNDSALTSTIDMKLNFFSRREQETPANTRDGAISESPKIQETTVQALIPNQA